VTRAREQASALSERLRRAGAEPVEFPTIRIEPPDDAYAALDRIDDLAAAVVLPGHGDPWTEGTSSAVTEARRNSKA